MAGGYATCFCGNLWATDTTLSRFAGRYRVSFCGTICLPVATVFRYFSNDLFSSVAHASAANDKIISKSIAKKFKENFL